MWEEEGSTGYIGHTGCTAPRSSVPSRHIAAMKRERIKNHHTFLVLN